MKYERNEYHEGFSICALVIAGIFLWWGFNIILDDMTNWWWFFGIFWILIGLSIMSDQTYKLTNRTKLRNIVKQEFEQDPTISVEKIASNTGITEKDTRAIILDLKARKEFRGKFSTKKGAGKHVEVASSSQKPSEEKGKYCANCGTPVKRDGSAVYCAYCGAKL
jgi:hypothetical protein